MLFALLLLWICKLVVTAPTSDHYITWENEPTGRGTWSILSSCVVTLVLCVYSAVHVNVSPAGDAFYRRATHVFLYVVAGIFAPEFVVWVAWCQWSDARDLTKLICATRTSGQPKEKPVQLAATGDSNFQHAQALVDSWTLQHSFFVIMGGYQFRPPTNQTNSPAKFGYIKPSTVLNAKTLWWMIANGHAEQIPILTADDVADRSKADNLTKLLSCVQGLWLMIQLIGRLADRLTITELEINTLAHVICALAMYAFWLRKPLGVQRPVFLGTKGLEGWILIQAGLKSSNARWLTTTKRSAYLRWTEQTSGPTTHVHGPDESGVCAVCYDNKRWFNPQSRTGICISNTAWTIDEVARLLNRDKSHAFFMDYVETVGQHDDLDVFPQRCDADGVTRTDIHLIGSEVDALMKLWQMPNRDEQLELYDHGCRLNDCTPMVGQHFVKDKWKLVSMIAISSLYGAIHASLWHNHFPSRVEHVLWRISSVLVAGNGFVVAMGCLFHYVVFKPQGSETVKVWFRGHDATRPIRNVFQRFFDYSEEHDRAWYIISTWLVVGFLVIIAFFTQLAFVFCRAFLFIEAFISLRSQPPDAYKTPQWSQWLPHL